MLRMEIVKKYRKKVIEKYYNNFSTYIGHSMGGALAVHTALLGKIDSLVGIVVVDVVEGTALDALSSMQSFLRGRPKNFPTIENAVEWALKMQQVKNTDSSRVSMPGQLKNAKTGECAVIDVPEKEPNVSIKL